MSKTQAKSFTFRLPLDVHEVFMAKVGERDRSRFVVQALKQALELTPEASSRDESGLDLAARVNELSYGLEVVKTQQDKVLQMKAEGDKELQLLKAEQDKVLQKVLQMKAEQTEQDKVLQKVLQHFASLEDNSRGLSSESEVIIQSKTEIQSSDPKNVLQSKTDDHQNTPESLALQFKPNEEKLKISKLTPSSDLVKILNQESKQESLGKNWTPSNLRECRVGGRETNWNIFGNCHFIYANHRKKIGNHNQYMWNVIHPSLKSDDDQ